MRLLLEKAIVLLENLGRRNRVKGNQLSAEVMQECQDPERAMSRRRFKLGTSMILTREVQATDCIGYHMVLKLKLVGGHHP